MSGVKVSRHPLRVYPQMSRPQRVRDVLLRNSHTGVMRTRTGTLYAATFGVAAAFLLSACGQTATPNVTPVTTSVQTSTAAAPTTSRPLLVPNATTPRATAEETAPVKADPLTKQVVDTLRAVDRFWEGKLNRTINVSVADPSATEPEAARCVAAVTDAARACVFGGDLFIAWKPSRFAQIESKAGGDLGATMILAHEYGHIVLELADEPISGGTAETRAWCLAGVYLNSRGVSTAALPSAITASAAPSSNAENEALRKKAVEKGLAAGSAGQCLRIYPE